MVFLVLSYASCSRVTYWGGSPMHRGTFEASLAYIIFYQTLSPLSGWGGDHQNTVRHCPLSLEGGAAPG